MHCPIHDATDQRCRLCWLSLPEEERPKWEDAPPSPIRVAIPCFYLGNELTGAERTAGGYSHLRTWHWCNHEKKPLGEAACHCKGCGPACPGYIKGEEP